MEGRRSLWNLGRQPCCAGRSQVQQAIILIYVVRLIWMRIGRFDSAPSEGDVIESWYT